MKQQHYGRDRVLSSALSLIALLVGMNLMLSAKAEYTPPKGDAPTGSTVANSSRGSTASCQTDSPLPLAVLAPTSHIGRISTTTPTLSWFVTVNAPYRIEVSFYRLSEEDAPELIYGEEEVTARSGLVRQSFPELDNLLQPG